MSMIVASGNAEELKRWSFDDCVLWAKEHNVDLRKLNLTLMQSEEDIKSSKDQWLPTVDFAMSHGYSNYPNPTEGQTGNSYNSSYGVNASWTVWDGNVRKYQIASSKILKEENELAVESRIDNLEVAILQAYLNIMYNREAVEVARGTLEVSKSQESRAKRLMETGRISKVEYAQIESERAQNEFELVQAESNYASAKMALKEILELGLEYDFVVEDIDFADELILLPLPDKLAVYEYALAWNHEIKSNDLNSEVLANDIKIAQAGYMPRIGLTAGIGTGYTTVGQGNWGSQIGHGVNENIGLTFSIPIFDGNSTKRNVAKARLAAMDYDLTDEQLRNELSQTIENLYIDCRSAQAKYVSGKKQVEAAELAAELVDRQFELGLVDPLEMLTAHNDLLTAKIALLQNKYMAILSLKMINYYATQTISLP